MKINRKISRREFLKLCLAGGAAGALMTSYPFLIERNLILVNTYRVPLRNLPPAFEGFTILQLADLHYRGDKLSELVVDWVVRKANQLEKDIIVNTGDNITEYNTHVLMDSVWEKLQRLRAPYGVFSVMGNHDHWASTKRSLSWLKHSGQGLRHNSTAIEKDGQRIWLGGCGDRWEDALGLDEAFAGVPQNEIKIALAHNPDSADEDYKTRLDLMISGHTHGGQVDIPFVGTPILPVNNKRYSSGLFHTPKTKLFISRGIGWTRIPVRLNCTPEIALLRLERAG